MDLSYPRKRPGSEATGILGVFARVGMRLLVLWKTGRLLALFAAVGVVLYSLAVFVSVAWTGNLGLRCVFGWRIIAVDHDPAAWRTTREVVEPDFRAPDAEGAVWSSSPPEPGDYLASIGPWRIGN